MQPEPGFFPFFPYQHPIFQPCFHLFLPNIALRLKKLLEIGSTMLPDVPTIKILHKIFLPIVVVLNHCGILVTPSHGLFMTMYTKLTLSRDVYQSFHATFRPFSGNFPFSLSSCTKRFNVEFFLVSGKISVFRDTPTHTQPTHLHWLFNSILQCAL